MGEEQDSDWETDEETNVVVKLSGVIRDEFIKNLSEENEPRCAALGLMTDEPLLQLGADLFEGCYSHPTGTHLLLKETRSAEGEMGLSYLCTSDKELNMNKLYIQQKTDPGAAGGTNTVDDTMAGGDNPSEENPSAGESVAKADDSTERMEAEMLECSIGETNTVDKQAESNGLSGGNT